jgi:hypothetical protein
MLACQLSILSTAAALILRHQGRVNQNPMHVGAHRYSGNYEFGVVRSKEWTIGVVPAGSPAMCCWSFANHSDCCHAMYVLSAFVDVGKRINCAAGLFWLLTPPASSSPPVQLHHAILLQVSGSVAQSYFLTSTDFLAQAMRGKMLVGVAS